MVAGGIVGWMNNNCVALSKNKGWIHYDISSGKTINEGSLGGIAGATFNSTVSQSFNEGTITSKYNNNYGMYNIGGIVGYHISSTLKNTYNLGNIYGHSYVGGICGCSKKMNGIERKNYFYNNYNASEIIEGTNKIGNYVGACFYGEGAYNGSILNKDGLGEGENNFFTDAEEYTLQQMKTTGSGLLTLLSKGEGNGIWAQSNNINNGLPYLVNNRP